MYVCACVCMCVCACTCVCMYIHYFVAVNSDKRGCYRYCCIY